MGSTTKIDWADATWNPVTGCLHGCEYCYARGIANRFGSHISSKDNLHVLDTPIRCTDTYCFMQMAGISAGRKQPYPYDFDPTFHRYKLEEPKRWRKPRNIFVCSMADLYGAWVPDEWIKSVFDACEAAPQHRYLFLTKNPLRYALLANRGALPESANMWYGQTITGDSEEITWLKSPNHLTFLSLEPLLAPLTLGAAARDADWVIIGAETGNRKKKVTPRKRWIEKITEDCAIYGVPVFMKESLREIMGSDFRQEFPWEAKHA